MKITSVGALLTYLLLLLATPVSAQSAVDYGSNMGNYVEVKNTRIYYETYGSGTPVLLLHGGMGSISNFQQLIPELSRHYKLIAMDSPSHGRSKSIDSLSYSILADYVVALIQTLELEKPHIIGYSDGAIVGMLAAQRAPNHIGKLVFGAGALSPYASKPEGLQMLQNIHPEQFPDALVSAYKAKSPNPENWTKFVYDSKKMWLDPVWVPKDMLPRTNTSVLVLFGDRDPFIPLTHSVEIHESLPKSQLCVLPDTGHEVFNSPERIIPILLTYLSEE